MRADDKIDPTLDNPAESGPPTLLLTAQPVTRSASDKGQSLTLAAETAVVMPESDPERVAFNLWNEGRVDEAIEFLEREIAERKRTKAPSRRRLSRARRKILGGAQEAAAAAADPQMSERRRQRLHALGAADFSATGAPIGETARAFPAVPADQIVPLPPPRRMWPLAVGLCLVTALGLSGAMYLYAPHSNQAASVTPVAPPADEPTETASISPPPSLPTTSDANNSGAETADAVDIPPPEGEADDPHTLQAEGVVEEPPVAAPAAAASTAPDDRREADNSAVPPEEEVAALTEGGSADASADADALPPPVVDVRLPRQRPEPPPEAVRAATALASRSAAAEDPAPEEEPTVPMVLGAPPATLQPPPGAVELPPIYAPTVANPYYGAPRRTTLSPEEYQALLERREMAEEYAAERRAEAEDEDSREYRIIGRVLPRWRRLGF